MLHSNSIIHHSQNTTYIIIHEAPHSSSYVSYTMAAHITPHSESTSFSRIEVIRMSHPHTLSFATYIIYITYFFIRYSFTSYHIIYHCVSFYIIQLRPHSQSFTSCVIHTHSLAFCLPGVGSHRPTDIARNSHSISFCTKRSFTFICESYIYIRLLITHHSQSF